MGHVCRSFESLITIELSISEIGHLPSGGNAPRSVGVWCTESEDVIAAARFRAS